MGTRDHFQRAALWSGCVKGNPGGYEARSIRTFPVLHVLVPAHTALVLAGRLLRYQLGTPKANARCPEKIGCYRGKLKVTG